MFSLLLLATTSAWTMFAEGAVLGATVFATGHKLSKK